MMHKTGRKLSGRLYRMATVTSHRSQSTGGGAANPQRLAGLRRFYREVTIQALPEAPWENHPKLTTAQDDRVESPLSAGVDGTQSASGVAHPTADSRAALATHLIPRRPGETATSASLTADNVDWYGVALDGRLLKTPMGATLAVPSALLATQIAAEWDALGGTDQRLRATQMPLMRLSCTTLDQTAHHMEAHAAHVLNFSPTDTLCFGADPTAHDDRSLYQRQQDSWAGVHARVKAVVGEPLAVALGQTEGLWLATTKTTSGGARKGLPHPPAVTAYSQAFCASLDAWHLTAMNQLAAEAKSFWLPWALLTDHDHPEDTLFRSVPDAIEAFRLEEEVQIDNWGFVEGGHDYDRLNTSVTVRAALLLRDSLAVERLQRNE
jgi:ATP synthase F1 complex assembly factor 2